MSDLQEVLLAVLSMTHPEVCRLRHAAPPAECDPPRERHRGRNGSPRRAMMRAVKFAFAALVAGSRAIPLGDNGCLTRELSAYGDRLQSS